MRHVFLPRKCKVIRGIMKQLSLPRRADPRKRVKKRPPCGAGANVEPPKRLRLKSREPGELYCSDIAYPSGISNPFSNCYANSILQCMMNHSSFSEITGGLLAAHPLHCSKECGCTGGTCVLASAPWHACIQN